MNKLQQYRNIYTLMLVIGIVISLCFTVAGLFYMTFIQQRNSELGMGQLSDTAHRVGASLLEETEGDLKLLRGVSIALEKATLESRDMLVELIRKVNNSNKFVRMAYADVNGAATMVDVDGSTYNNVDFSGVEAFRQALAGEESVTGIMPSVVTGSPVNYVAVPMWRDGQIVGVLIGANEYRVLGDIIDAPVFEGEGRSYVVDSAGVIIMPYGFGVSSLGEGPVAHYDSRSEEEALYRAIEARESHTYYVTLNGVRNVAALLPIEAIQDAGLNEWFVVSTAPAEVVDRYYDQTVYGFVAILAGACLIFIFLLLSYRVIATRNEKTLKYLAFVDPITEGPNKARFLQDAKEALAKNTRTPFYLWSMDIKQFKRINDVLGYARANDLLREMARVIENASVDTGLSCHVAADQFVGAGLYADEWELERWFTGLCEGINALPLLTDRELRAEVSTGVFVLDEENRSLSLEDMISRATMAKEVAKAALGNAIHCYDAELGESLRRETRLEMLAQNAIRNGELQFYLQPKIDIQHGDEVVGAEALARWIRPEEGMISPGEFIPLFERNGFIIDLDRHMFRELCRFYKAYLLPLGNPLHISINVSRVNFLQEDFVGFYHFVKEESGIPDGVIELEITESVVMDDYSSNRQKIKKLHDAGFLCSIDDFGSGYSSLNVLKELPVDAIKLDAVFFRDMEDMYKGQVIVEYFVRMATKLGIQTVSEGIESQGQVDFLRRVGCQIIQGYYFSKPLPKERFIEYVTARR